MEKTEEDRQNKYEKRAKVMISRWAGERGPPRKQSELSELETSRSEELEIGTNNFATKNATHVSEPAKKLPILARCEVLVVGGGPSGLSAALGARRAGADVILMERYGCFGGVITTVGMETIVLESGVRPLLHCTAVEVIMNGNTIRGVITESKSGRQAILADRVIDCSGDADIAFLAGAKYRKTPKDEMMGVTTVFSCAGVDKNRFIKHTEQNPATYKDWSRTWDQETTGKEDSLRSPYLDREFDTAREKGVIPADGTTQNLGGSWSALSDAGEATNLNLVHITNCDCTNVEELTRAEMEGRKQAMHAIQALKHVVPGFEKVKLRNFGMTLGCRDSRKIIGRYNLTGEDVRNQARFKDSVGIFPEFIDGYNILILPTTGRYFEVPYGCLVPLGVENLLVAGRCVAGDKVSHCAMRNMMACTVTGQGAGVAAAVSLKEGVSSSCVEIECVQAELKRQGVRVH